MGTPGEHSPWSGCVVEVEKTPGTCFLENFPGYTPITCLHTTMFPEMFDPLNQIARDSHSRSVVGGHGGAAGFKFYGGKRPA